MNNGTHRGRPRLLFIASLGRSGSTLLDLLLGANPQMVGLGEVWKTLRLAGEDQHTCTCGAPGLECPVWGAILESRRRAADQSMGESYRALVARAREVHGDAVLVDSSKDLPVLVEVAGVMDKQLQVLFLLKDVRAYAASAADADRAPGATLVKDALHRSSFLRALQWYQRNRAFADYLQGSGLSFMQLGYEELCFRPEFILGKICDFAGVPFDAMMLSPTTSNSHILRGNPMRWSSSRRKAIVYDNRWFYRPKIQMLAAALPFVFSWNTQNVYRNIGPAALLPDGRRP